MPKTLRALSVVIILGLASGRGTAASEKEFQTREGLVRISAAQASATPSDHSAAIPAPVPVFDLDSLADLTKLQLARDSADPLLEIHFQDYVTGEELRFPVKLSQLQDFLSGHAGEFTQPTEAARSVTMVRVLSKGMRVRMVEPGMGDSK